MTKTGEVSGKELKSEGFLPYVVYTIFTDDDGVEYVVNTSGILKRLSEVRND